MSERWVRAGVVVAMPALSVPVEEGVVRLPDRHVPAPRGYAGASPPSPRSDFRFRRFITGTTCSQWSLDNSLYNRCTLCGVPCGDR